MTCAKKQVKCTIVCTNGKRYVGENFCLKPQERCPREKGEGYRKCHSICQQMGHAEENAVFLAGSHAKGGTAIIEGIGWICRNCQETLVAAGVRTFIIA